MIGWSGFSYYSFKKAKQFNCIKVLERGSSHILYQSKILKEEYNRLNLATYLPSKKTIETVKEKIPNSKIFIVECSNLNQEQND